MSTGNDTAAALAELDRVSSRTRTALRSVWYPLVVFGALVLGAGVLASVASGPAYAAYWLIGYAAAFVAVGRYYTARARQVGVADDARQYMRLWLAYPVASIVAGSVAASLGGDEAVVAAQTAVIAALYLLLARLQRSPLLSLVGIAVFAYGVILALASPAHLWEIAYFGIGAALVVSGLYARAHEESQ